MISVRRIASATWLTGGAGDYWAHLQADKSTLRALQAGRALAALMVAFSHMVLPTNEFVEPLPSWLAEIMSHGYLGVDFFFVLSGFIIYWINRDVAVQPGWTRHYLTSRLTRIYLPYWPVGIALALAYTLFGEHSRSDLEWSWWTTITLIPVAAPSALSLAWTLSFELMFYLLAWLFFRTGRPLTCGLAWAAVILLLWSLGVRFKQPFDVSALSLLFNPINVEFVMGMLAAHAVRSDQTKIITIASFAAVLAGGTAFAWLGFERAQSPLFGLAMAGLVVILVRAERANRVRVATTWVLVGNASYALYLLHLPLMSIVARGVRMLGPLAHWQTSIVLSAAAAVLSAVAYHIFYERPALRLARRLRGVKASMKSAPPPTA